MPLAVFLCQVQEEAMHLFSRLYRQSWSESVKSGISFMQESDVRREHWEMIHEVYMARKEKEERDRLVNFVPPPPLPVYRPIEQGTTFLETSKYYR